MSTEKVFWAHIYKIGELTKKINAVHRRQMDEKALLGMVKRFDKTINALGVQLGRLEKLLGVELEVKD
tara:strand:+ start:1550 stop:1753 length:204 start_codon:yes stop_codon:yes gene_type:complete